MFTRWYQEAIIYCLDVETYADSNGDGIGDFAGLTNRLNYIAGLGFDCIWLLPFLPTPNRDNGYDISDYYAVDPRLGNLGDFVEFTRHAHERGLRVIIDLVINHTSIEHHWFQQARADPASPYRDYYIWSEQRPPDADQGMMFPGHQQQIWTYDESAQAYYFHRFFPHQPDLNIANPHVRDEIARIIGFWLQLGVDGFRIDAAPFVIERVNIDVADVIDPYAFLTDLRHGLDWRRGDAVFLAEADVDVDQLRHYFGNADRVHLLFNFVLNQHLYLALARRSAEPLRRALYLMPEKPALCQWAVFVRNHDELALGQLSTYEQEEISRAFGFTSEMWLYNRGVPRRLPTILGGDQQRIKQVYNILLTLPGTPVIRYGEEIGMGDDPSLEGRNPVRTPMQWSSRSNGGFSTAPAEQLIRPVISDGEYGYAHTNVDSQQRRQDSLLNYIENMLRVRRECPEIGRGEPTILATDHPGVLAIRYRLGSREMIALHNLAAEQVDLDFDAGLTTTTLEDLLHDGTPIPVHERSCSIALEGYESRWLRASFREARLEDTYGC
jgi:maltose alpha-D-glucosyltransferase/alpha-amylase